MLSGSGFPRARSWNRVPDRARDGDGGRSRGERQIEQTAAYDDRQSISETVRAEQGEAGADHRRSWPRPARRAPPADYGVAAALDRQAPASAGAVGQPRSVSREEVGPAPVGARLRRALPKRRPSGRATIGERWRRSRAQHLARSTSRRVGGRSRRNSRRRSTRRESLILRGSRGRQTTFVTGSTASSDSLS